LAPLPQGVRAVGGAGGGAAAPAAPAAAAAASPAPAALAGNKGQRVDDDNPVEIDDNKVGIFGGQYVAVKDYTSINEPRGNARRAQRLIQAHPTYTADDFNNGRVPLGVFTFLVAVDVADAGLTHRLCAKEVRSELELGTRHHSIACDATLGIKSVLCGGEIEKTAGGLRFNLQSGHYTVTRFTKLRKPAKGLDMDNVRDKSKNYKEAVLALLPTATHVEFEPDATFIKEGAIRNSLDDAEMHLYTSCGLSIFLFDDRRNAMDFQQNARNGKEEEADAMKLLGYYRGTMFEPEVTKAAEAEDAGGGAGGAGAGGAPPRRNSRRKRQSRSRRQQRRQTRRRR
jgi:hypothetical protein